MIMLFGLLSEISKEGACRISTIREGKEDVILPADLY
jgi:hypothetical protein